jgi:hypothetical protein
VGQVSNLPVALRASWKLAMTGITAETGGCG